ncbi:MAG TPA: VOC family protein [Solirubrobacterales bacterium]|nr:VOC family protein [Solirubrobacterales bacterium]
MAVGAALCVAAGVLIASFVGDPHPEETIAKLGYTAMALSVFGPCAVAGLLLVARRPRWAPFGYLTAAITLLGFAAITVRIIEGDLPFGASVELQVIGLVLTLALSQASLALASDRSDDPLLLRLVTLATIVVVLGLGVLGALEAAVDSVRLSDQLYGVLFTLYLLGAALLVLFRLLTWRRGRSEVGSVPLDHVVIAVSDRAAAVRFYTGLLGAGVVERPEGRIAFRVGEQLLNVHEPGLLAAPLAANPVRPGNSDLCFAWPGSPQLAIELVGALGAELVEGPVPRTGARGPGQSVYCRDPDGSLVELISYG